MQTRNAPPTHAKTGLNLYPKPSLRARETVDLLRNSTPNPNDWANLAVTLLNGRRYRNQYPVTQ
jgi:hypothetical protein